MGGNRVDPIFRKYFYILSLLSAVANLGAFYGTLRDFLVLFPCLYNEHNITVLFGPAERCGGGFGVRQSLPHCEVRGF